MELRRMYVAPDERRAGLGRTMLRHADDLTRSFGAKTIGYGVRRFYFEKRLS